MTAPLPLTDDIAQAQRPPDRATCPLCGGSIVVKRENGKRVLEHHHDPAIGFTRWCDGSDKRVDEH